MKDWKHSSSRTPSFYRWRSPEAQRSHVFPSARNLGAEMGWAPANPIPDAVLFLCKTLSRARCTERQLFLLPLPCPTSVAPPEIDRWEFGGRGTFLPCFSAEAPCLMGRPGMFQVPNKPGPHPPDASYIPQLSCGRHTHTYTDGSSTHVQTPARRAALLTEIWVLFPPRVMALCFAQPSRPQLCAALAGSSHASLEISRARFVFWGTKLGHVTLSNPGERSSCGQAFDRFCLSDALLVSPQPSPPWGNWDTSESCQCLPPWSPPWHPSALPTPTVGGSETLC